MTTKGGRPFHIHQQRRFARACTKVKQEVKRRASNKTRMTGRERQVRARAQATKVKERNANREANKSALYTRAHVLDEISAAARACPKKHGPKRILGLLKNSLATFIVFLPNAIVKTKRERKKEDESCCVCRAHSLCARRR